MNTDTKQEPCEHEYVKSTERIMPIRLNDKQPEFTHQGAYFIYNICQKCGKRAVLDYVVEG